MFDPDSGDINFDELLEFFLQHLHHQILPFWMNHCVDHIHGGINNCVRDDGKVISTEKYLWSQGRALWVFSHLFNAHDKDPKWLELAKPIAQMLLEHGRNDKGEWFFSLQADGSPGIQPQSIYVDGFCIYGLTEYARATGDTKALQAALDSYLRVNPLLDDHSSFQTLPHPIPEGYQAHGPIMMFALVFHELGIYSNNIDVIDRALQLADQVMTRHLDQERQVLLEFIRPEGKKADGDIGKTFIPGHAIESMWFMEKIYRYHGIQERIHLAMEVIKWHLEKGWDSKYGGLYLACHMEGGIPAWHSPESKIWWPHTESLQSLLLAYLVTGANWTLEWYRKIHDYTFSHFPNSKEGEWFHNLDRKGNPIPPYLKTLPVKDLFHLPRALIYSINLLKQISLEHS